MTTLHSFNDLNKFGIGVLTGEACNYGMRLLCDLTAQGVELVNNFLGVDSAAYSDPWNSSVDGRPSLASVFLSRAMLHDLCIFALLHVEGNDVVLVKGGTVMGLKASHEYYPRYMAIVSEPSSGYTVYRRTPSAVFGDSAKASQPHAMTGRTQ